MLSIARAKCAKVVFVSLNMQICDVLVTVVVTPQLCWWERPKQKFGFIKRVDKGWITTVKDLET